MLESIPGGYRCFMHLIPGFGVISQVMGCVNNSCLMIHGHAAHREYLFDITNPLSNRDSVSRSDSCDNKFCVMLIRCYCYKLIANKPIQTTFSCFWVHFPQLF